MQTLYQQHFSGRFSGDPITQGHLEKQTEAMIDLSNTYVKCVVANNGRIMTILENNWHLVDPDDADEFSQFQIHYTRFLTEVEQQRRENLPMQVKLKLGDISFMHPKMIERIKGAVQKRQRRLKDLHSSWVSRFGN